MLSSWVARVACRYGLETRDLAQCLTERGRGERSRFDDTAPDLGQIRLWARACRIDPMRLQRLSLTHRHPKHTRLWFLERAGHPMPVCFACFDADCMAGCDSYIRADWSLAEYFVCPVHRQMLRDRCPFCERHLYISFRMRDGHARPFCRKCNGQLTSRGGGHAARMDAEIADSAFAAQRQAGKVIAGDPVSRTRLESRIATLWAPLDRPGAARPIFALWFNQAGWCCPSELRVAVGNHAALRQLPVRWRALTLVVLQDLFGSSLSIDAVMPEAARNLFRRAAPRPVRGPVSFQMKCRAANVQRSGKVTTPGEGKKVSPEIEQVIRPPIKREFARREGCFAGCPPIKQE
ncbi:MAG: TniQ family protein [Amylibacter sp.]|nr:TniQ family protein [Amylibacter sp.]